MPRQHLSLAFFGLVLSSFSGGVLAQSEGPAKDPVLDSIFKAEDEGRLLDAERLVKAAIPDAEAQPSASGRLRLLLVQLASLDSRMGHTADAIVVVERMIETDEKAAGGGGMNLVRDLSALGTYYQMAGNEAAAGHAFERELAVARESGKGLLLAIWNLSYYYTKAHRTADAEALLTEAVQICDEHPGRQIPDCSTFRTGLADLYSNQGHPEAAEDLVSSGAAQTVGAIPDWYTQVKDLDVLAQQYEQNQSYSLAETTYRRAIAVIEGDSHLKSKAGALGGQFDHLGRLFEKEGRDADAEDVYRQGLDSAESGAKTGHPELAGSFTAFTGPLEGIYRKEGRVADAEPILQQALAVQERVLGPENISLADTLVELAGVYGEEGKYADAEPLYQPAIAIQEQNNGPDDPQLIGTLDQYAQVLRQLGQPEKAQAVADRSAALSQKLAQQTQKTGARN